jgi:hypothetical protein
MANQLADTTTQRRYEDIDDVIYKKDDIYTWPAYGPRLLARSPAWCGTAGSET